MTDYVQPDVSSSSLSSVAADSNGHYDTKGHLDSSVSTANVKMASKSQNSLRSDSDSKDRGRETRAETRASSADVEERHSNNGRVGTGANVSQSSSVSGGNGGGGSGNHNTSTSGGGGGGGGVGGGGGGGGTARKQHTSFFSGSKIKHLKKPDGVPLWRKDIQYEFLQAIFTDKKPVFTNSYDRRGGQTFADVYIDAMARSSKTSKILRDKLTSERPNALNMAMVCLLVNVGRMNTTLNFFPEMKAQLRTYHSIPSLQSYTDAHAYKQLQDAPRLKSILKGACEDRKEPLTLEHLMALVVPRTNPINLVFLLATYAPKISELHFPESRDFYDLIMRSTLSSKSRARAFMWLMWWYLEGDFTAESARNNPFGPGQDAKDGGIPCRVPQFEHLTEEQAAKENVDAPAEIEFGERMQHERKRLLENHDNAPAPPTGKKGKKHIAPSPEEDEQSATGGGSPPTHMATPGDRNGPRSVRNSTRTKKRDYSSVADFSYEYDSDQHQTRQGSPDGLPVTPSGNALEVPPRNKGGRPRGSGRRNVDGELKNITPRITLRMGPKQNLADGASGHSLTATRSIAPSTGLGDRGTPSGTERSYKPRPLTSHQLAVQQNRRDRAEYIISRKLKRLDKRSRKSRLREGGISRAWRRIKNIEDPFVKSDDERDFAITRERHLVVRATPAMEKDKEVLEEATSLVEKPTNGLGDSVVGIEVDSSAVATTDIPLKKIKVENAHNTDHHAKRYGNGTTHRSLAGLAPTEEEEDDYGEEALALAAAIRRSRRRLDRWEREDRLRASGLVPAPRSTNSLTRYRVAPLLPEGGSTAPGDETREASEAGYDDEEMMEYDDEELDVEMESGH